MTFEPTRCSTCGKWVIPDLAKVVRASDTCVVVPCGSCGNLQEVSFVRVKVPEQRVPLLSRRVVS